MASITINGDTSGGITIASPAVAGTNTLTLPAATGTLITESMTLLGTLTTTSGTTQTLSGLNLTGYKSLYVAVDNVSITSTTSQITLNGVTVFITNNATQSVHGVITIALLNGVFGSLYNSILTTGSASGSFSVTGGYSNGGKTTITNATTSLTVAGGTFDAGTITVYGVK